MDSIHRNIAEGYCRRSIREYLQYLNIALSSAGESVSGLHAYRHASQIPEADFERLETAAWKLENGLRRLIESLQYKKDGGEWDDSFVVKESNEEYQTVETTNAQQNGTDAKDRCLEETKYASDAQRLNRSKRK